MSNVGKVLKIKFEIIKGITLLFSVMLIAIFSVAKQAINLNVFFYASLILFNYTSSNMLVYKSRFEVIWRSISVSKKDIIKAEYIIGLCLTFIYFIITIIIVYLISLTKTSYINFTFQYIVNTLLNYYYGTLFVLAIYIPINILVKKKNIMNIVNGGLCGVIGFISSQKMLRIDKTIVNLLPSYNILFTYKYSVLILLILIVIYYISHLISIKIYKNKEI